MGSGDVFDLGCTMVIIHDGINYLRQTCTGQWLRFDTYQEAVRGKGKDGGHDGTNCCRSDVDRGSCRCGHWSGTFSDPRVRCCTYDCCS